MMKDLMIKAHDELALDYLEDHPEATEDEAYEATADKAYDHMVDKLADLGDALKDRMKEERGERWLTRKM